jgi:hypothetical protein
VGTFFVREKLSNQFEKGPLLMKAVAMALLKVS